MITARTKYALKALLHLARHREQGRLRAVDIAVAENVPLRFLEQILHGLREHGIVISHQGKGGGHELARRPDQLDLLEIWRAVEGPVAPVPCLSQTAYARCDDCEDERTCGVRKLLREVHSESLRILEGTTLADALAGRSGRGRN